MHSSWHNKNYNGGGGEGGWKEKSSKLQLNNSLDIIIGMLSYMITIQICWNHVNKNVLEDTKT